MIGQMSFPTIEAIDVASMSTDVFFILHFATEMLEEVHFVVFSVDVVRNVSINKNKIILIKIIHKNEQLIYLRAIIKLFRKKIF